jgi:hypothetical protein
LKTRVISVVKTDGKELVFKSELAGVVTIPWDAVVGITSQEPLTIGLRDGQVAVGPVETEGQSFVIATKDAGTLTAPKPAIIFIRSKDEQNAYEAEIERYRHPSLTDLWTGFVDLGLASAQGNARTSNVNVSAAASRSTSRDKIEVNFTSLYASSNVSGVSLVTANAIRGGIRYNLNISPMVLGFGSTDLEYDEFQNLDLRFSPAGGLGWRLIDNERTMFNVLGGASLNREFFGTGLNRTSGEMLVGQEFTHKLTKIAGIAQKFIMYPNLTRRGEYRMSFDVSAVTTLRKWLGWQFSVRSFSEQPPSGEEDERPAVHLRDPSDLRKIGNIAAGADI